MEKFFARVLSVLIMIVSISPRSTGQTRQFISSEYNRNALTVLLLKTNDTYNSQLLPLADSLKIPEKFFDNNLSSTLLAFDAQRTASNLEDNYSKTFKESLLSNTLQQAKIPNQIIAKWFDRKEDGSFGVETLAERGVYNATDNAVLVANASKRGTAGLMDMGMGLVDKSYILLIDVAQLLSMAEIYERDTVPADQRTMNGYRAKINVYVYKLDFNEGVAANFFENLWIGNESEEGKAEKVE